MPNGDTNRSSYTWPVIIALLLVLSAGVWFIYHTNTTRRADSGILAEQFEWTLTPAPGAQGTTTDIQLRIAGVSVPVRSLPGTCVELSKTSWELLQDELSGVVCRDASGEGAEIGVFQSGDVLVLKQGTVTGDERTDFAQIVQER